MGVYNTDELAGDHRAFIRPLPLLPLLPDEE
jgi:hypothetical protein